MGNNKSSYLEKPLTFPIAGQVQDPIDKEPSSSSKNRANDTLDHGEDTIPNTAFGSFENQMCRVITGKILPWYLIWKFC